ncbi:MAG: citrate/2-methylcitrate synthase [Gammaproteobacteria bacterium]|nr:citrate/2-methylcitrate synthase [Gammaproteobacteria bacterium]
MGFGHRVYKNYDPRATGHEADLRRGARAARHRQRPAAAAWPMKLEKIALEDPYFVDKKLYPNVDFYSGIILKAIGIPVNMFTVIFATGRTPGWVAHWNEMISGTYRIGRPRQLYTGETARDLKPIDQR